MALSYKARRGWALVVLVIGLPIYILLATLLATWLDPQSILIELLIYIVLGVVWVLPFKSLFRGIGQADPDRTDHDRE